MGQQSPHREGLRGHSLAHRSLPEGCPGAEFLTSKKALNEAEKRAITDCHDYHTNQVHRGHDKVRGRPAQDRVHGIPRD
jgi:hypothetical protein